MLFRKQTHLSLDDRTDTLSLVRPDGVTVDTMGYDRAVPNDRSYCRTVDGGGAWSRDCDATPGGANRLWPTPEPDEDATATGGAFATGLTSIATARAAPEDTRATVVGAVTLPPGAFGRSIYIQDETGGIRVYLRGGDYPPLELGTMLQVTGWTRDYYGDRELSAPDTGYLKSLGAGVPPDPVRAGTGRLGEEDEGRLVWIAGKVTAFGYASLTLDDGTGLAEVYFPESEACSRPFVHLGSYWSATGVVSQYSAGDPVGGGYRAIPRRDGDLAPPPNLLPAAGSGWTNSIPKR